MSKSQSVVRLQPRSVNLLEKKSVEVVFAGVFQNSNAAEKLNNLFLCNFFPEALSRFLKCFGKVNGTDISHSDSKLQ